MISVSEQLLASFVAQFLFPDPDDPGPFNPRALTHEPDPSPWSVAFHQAAVVAEIVNSARLLEAGSSGAGIGALRKVLDDPDNWCPTGPRYPRPPKPHLNDVDLLTIGAAFMALASRVPEEQIASLAAEGGARLMAKASGGG